MSPQRFSSTHRVSYAECTMGNHVYHSRFLEILERARGEFFRSLNCALLQLQEEDVIFPMVACELKFHAMARYDDLLTIEQWVVRLGRARFSSAGLIRNADGVLLFEAVTHLACTTIAGRPQRMPARLREAFRNYLADGPEVGSGS